MGNTGDIITGILGIVHVFLGSNIGDTITRVLKIVYPGPQIVLIIAVLGKVIDGAHDVTEMFDHPPGTREASGSEDLRKLSSLRSGWSLPQWSISLKIIIVTVIIITT